MIKLAAEVCQHLLFDFLSVVSERYSSGYYECSREELEAFVVNDINHLKTRLNFYQLPEPAVSISWGDDELLKVSIEFSEEQQLDMLSRKIEWSRW